MNHAVATIKNTTTIVLLLLLLLVHEVYLDRMVLQHITLYVSLLLVPLLLDSLLVKRRVEELFDSFLLNTVTLN